MRALTRFEPFGWIGLDVPSFEGRCAESRLGVPPPFLKESPDKGPPSLEGRLSSDVPIYQLIKMLKILDA